MITVDQTKQSTTTSERRFNTLPDSVATDICQVCGGKGISLANLCIGLTQLNILKRNETLVTYQDLSAWKRGGAETYVSDFVVEVDTELGYFSSHVISKAIVKYAPDVTWKAWSNRVKRLGEYQVPVPHTYSYWEGILFQDYIPYDFRAYYSNAVQKKRDYLLSQLFHLAERVDAAGFQVSGFVHNLRTDGNMIFLIDFGEDLGDFSAGRQGSTARGNVHRWLTR